MRNLLALVGAATVTFVALGWYLDWYKVERQAAPAGFQRLQVDINPKKIGEDVTAGVERGAEVISQLRNKPGDATSVNLSTPNPALPPAAQLPGVSIPADNGWRPISTTPTGPVPHADNRFNIRPLPPPR